MKYEDALFIQQLKRKNSPVSREDIVQTIFECFPAGALSMANTNDDGYIIWIRQNIEPAVAYAKENGIVVSDEPLKSVS